jgi:uncharacterized membrane protein
MLGLTTLGFIHTLIGLVALACGVVVLVRDKEIRVDDGLGRAYVVGTLLTALTGLGIFQHGGFGPPHVLALMTVAALALGVAATASPWFGRAARYVQAVSYSSTILFHMIPAVTETSVRLPVGKPLMSSPEDPALQPVFLGLMLALVVGLAFQLRWIHGQQAGGQAPAAAGSLN